MITHHRKCSAWGGKHLLLGKHSFTIQPRQAGHLAQRSSCYCYAPMTIRELCLAPVCLPVCVYVTPTSYTLLDTATPCLTSTKMGASLCLTDTIRLHVVHPSFDLVDQLFVPVHQSFGLDQSYDMVNRSFDLINHSFDLFLSIIWSCF